MGEGSILPGVILNILFGLGGVIFWKRIITQRVILVNHFMEVAQTGNKRELKLNETAMNK